MNPIALAWMAVLSLGWLAVGIALLVTGDRFDLTLYVIATIAIHIRWPPRH